MLYFEVTWDNNYSSVHYMNSKEEYERVRSISFPTLIKAVDFISAAIKLNNFLQDNKITLVYPIKLEEAKNLPPTILE